MQTTDTIVNLPFQGFYESIYSEEIDSIEEREAKWMVKREKEDGIPAEHRLDEGDYSEFFLSCTDYGLLHRNIAKAYVDAFNGLMSSYIEIELGLRLEAMSSPRHYNFETDRVFAYIGRDIVAKLFARSVADEHKTLECAIKERFTSYDGFCSHYDNQLDAWLTKPLDEWDHNELGTLLLAVMELSGVTRDILTWDVYEIVTNNDGIGEDWQTSVDRPKFDGLIAEAREKKREAYALEHSGEPVPEPSCPLTLTLPL